MMCPDAAVIIPWGGRQLELLEAQLVAVHTSATSAERKGVAAEIILSCNAPGSLAAATALRARVPGLHGFLRLVDSSQQRGPAHARNIGAAETEARVLLFCDADDIVDTDWVWEMVSALRGVDIARGRLDPSRNRYGQAPATGDAASPKPIYRHLGYGPMSNLGILREAYEAVGGADPGLRIGEDVDLCWRAQYAGYTFGIAPSATVFLRWRPTLREHFRQAFDWGQGDVELLHRHRQHGARATRPGRFVGQLVKLPIHLSAGLLSGTRRWTSVHRAGKILGRIVGSVRRRTWAV